MKPTNLLTVMSLLAVSAIMLQGCGGSPENNAGAVGDIPPKKLVLPRAKMAADARIFIIEPANGAVVKSPVKVAFGAENADTTVANIFRPNSGHHHLILDAPLPELSQPVPSDENHYHYDQGETEATLELPPGTHTLQLLLADGNHVPHDPALVSEIVTITVE